MNSLLNCLIACYRIASGYYLKTPTNTPLLGPVKSTTPSAAAASQYEGLFLCAGVSGFGVMCSQSAGEVSAGNVLEYLNGEKKLMWKNKLSSGVCNEFDPNFWMDPAMVLKRTGDGSMKTANQL